MNGCQRGHRHTAPDQTQCEQARGCACASTQTPSPCFDGRRQFLTAATAAVGTLGMGFLTTPFVRSLGPTAFQARRQSPVMVDISSLGEGQRLTVHWQDQPVWVVRRSQAMLEALPFLNIRLKDPFSENTKQQPDYVLTHRLWRSIRPEISVLIGLCTHLGCIPQMVSAMAPQPFDDDWKGGYFCPCHRSRFDMAGRVYQQGPALANLVVPPYRFQDANTLMIGVGPEADISAATIQQAPL